MRILLFNVAFFWLLSGCATYGKISNQPLGEIPDENRYAFSRTVDSQKSPEVTLLVTFSGGGMRAAALAYGVLRALRDSRLRYNGNDIRLLDEIDAISSVSGGSFTAAYFGLYGDRIFTDFDKNFLRRNITGELVSGLFNPGLWLSRSGRTEMAVRHFEKRIFGDATFADLQAGDGPLILINASDIGRGVRFSFLQEYFDLLCSDLSSFPVSRAVAASSAVPILFHPVILQNHAGCETGAYDYMRQARSRVTDSPQLEKLVQGLSSYELKQERQYIHLVDGGITDNLGLLAFLDMVEIAGGARPFLYQLGGKPAPRLLVISVNASTTPQYAMDTTNKVSSMEELISAVTSTQLQRTNTNTLQEFREGMLSWSEDLSSRDFKVESYFVQVDFSSLRQSDRRLFFNQIPASLSLQPEQVDELIRAGYELLTGNTEFQRFLADVKAPRETTKSPE